MRLLAPATVKPAASSDLLWPLVFSLASHITYYALLVASTDALTPTLALFPRNLLLLRWPARSAASPLFQQRWTQFSLLYLAGSVGSLWASDDLGGFRIPGWRRGSDDEEGARALQLDDFDLPTPPPLYRRHSGEYGANSDSKSSSRPSRLLLSLLPFLPLLFAAALSPLSFVRLDNSCRLLPAAVRSSVCPFLVPVGAPRTVDIVISYYDENLEETREHIRNLRLSQFVAARHDRVILYNKGPHSEELLRSSLNLSESDDVVPLENLGREGGTYLSVRIRVGWLLSVSAVADAFRENSTAHPAALQPDSGGPRALGRAEHIPAVRAPRRRRRPPEPPRFRRHDLLLPAAFGLGRRRRAAPRESDGPDGLCPLWAEYPARVREGHGGRGSARREFRAVRPEQLTGGEADDGHEFCS